LKKTSEVQINEAWCKSCGVCVAVCPKKVLVLGTFTAQVAHPELCIGCRMCENLCPDFAITVQVAEEEPEVVK